MIAERIKLLVTVRMRKLLRPILISALALTLGIAFGAAHIAAQQATPDLGPPPPPPQAAPPSADQPPATPDLGPPAPPADPSKESSSATTNAPAEPAAPAAPAFDPLRAQKSVDVGQYYLKNGNYAAAIDRYKEAISYQSNMALPWEFLGQAYEKEHEREEAVAAYQKYLAMMPSGKEPDKVRKEVAKLQAEIVHDAAGKPGR